MKKAAISLSFDDGRGDNQDIFQEILFPMGIPVTINITTGYVDGSCPSELLPSTKPAVSMEYVKQLANNPLAEVALHGDQHLNTEKDIAAGREKLIKWLKLPEDAVLGFASPGSGLSVEHFRHNDADLFTKQISYLRTSLRINHFHWLRVLCRKAGRVFHIPLLYRIAYADTLMNDCEDRVIYSVPVMKDATFAQVKAILDLAIQRRCALTLMFHSITEQTEGEDNWSWEKEKFAQLCNYLRDRSEERKLDVLTTAQLVKKISM